MSRMDEFEGYQQIAYVYRHGAPLVKPELVKDLPQKYEDCINSTFKPVLIPKTGSMLHINTTITVMEMASY